MSEQYRERWRLLLPFIQAYVDGHEIEQYVPKEGWIECERPAFTMSHELYRIVPKPQYRPFGNAAEFVPYRDRWLMCRTNPRNGHCRAQSFDDEEIGLSDGRVRTYIGLLKEYMFEDGSPCGVVVKPDQPSQVTP